MVIATRMARHLWRKRYWCVVKPLFTDSPEYWIGPFKDYRRAVVHSRTVADVRRSKDDA